MAQVQNKRSLICAPIVATRPEDVFASMAEARHVADAIELRLDYLAADALQQVMISLCSDLSRADRQLIITLRPREQGGKRDLTLHERRQFWLSLSPEIIESIAFADFELDLAESFAGDSPVPWNKVICSYHNFEETPSDLPDIYDRIARAPAAVIKIATKVNRIGDCLGLFDLIDWNPAGKPLIVLGMGTAGVMTRVLALSRGAMLTFGALEPGAESAAGQPTVDELNNLYRVKRLTRDSEIYGVIGNPIGHSRSPLIHNTALAAANRNGVYLPFEVDDLDQFVRDFVRPATRKIDWRLRGLSVTIPHKLSIIPHLDFIDETALRIGAVNTVVVKGDQLRGYNTDAIGAMKPLDESIDVKGARVAVIGAGGAARAICHGLNERGADVTIYARDLGKAQRLADEFSAKTASIEDFDGEADVVINCTPIGMRGHSEGRSPIKAESLNNVELVYDLVYNPEETTLLRDARNAGRRTLGGMAMLLGQAAEQIRLWKNSPDS
jgi:3-dehydroquinate dehydratase/shikimate dehydrogenase